MMRRSPLGSLTEDDWVGGENRKVRMQFLVSIARLVSELCRMDVVPSYIGELELVRGHANAVGEEEDIALHP